MNLYNNPYFNGYPVQHHHGDLIQDILIANDEVLSQVISTHKRVAVFRFELKFPIHYKGNLNVTSAFFDSLRSRLKNDLMIKSLKRDRDIDSEIGYVWVRELSSNLGWHYHVVLFLNYDVYNCFGLIKSKNNNIYNRILNSWATALGLTLIEASGLVHIDNNRVVKLDAKSIDYVDMIHAVLYRLSYLAKLKTKPYSLNSGVRLYGTSTRNRKNIINDSPFY